MPADEQPIEPRKKRAKIVSACGECRRKKTKCNGEQPCRNCLKSGVPCVYPSSSHSDDRRNAPSKAALEAIEDRLKTIEDMLKTILQSHLPVNDLDPVAQPISQPPHSTPARPSTPHDLRLPSIHNLSASSAYSHHLSDTHESRDLPPLGLHDYHLYPTSYKSQSSNSCKSHSETEEYSLQPMKKRKR
ncbi:Zn(2)-C6 fungal-specific transcription factor [Phycomyces blakesleeanus NRRL 1555(-)]|uniref:Zn(2)-C6 fungal-specific transcription factor n=1 Tax=Phycomyces blakesleeanus (strain ATCC 8743b / DSM 1359 / FGSC 10004 / NBRC 33097 / NRRL 1555) TaxID=763407 RepID=A0A162UJ55_PHYB8|nr:Zn(2)-C6 fungal-specific transcription factor [Phycomyces blakesleeanus NRRL 1555(-)]OAD75653.1 Zn(2)-C6 fungal-specific transcription factor [Phycomyces blakesleeanus NRRL 1555(-)]|eukprot:XP_018293693.1 Zn(2)-C6 fungal-specific transcription factor [Phycomyces blakesleeanus NRRL 1555(-)]